MPPFHLIRILLINSCGMLNLIALRVNTVVHGGGTPINPLPPWELAFKSTQKLINPHRNGSQLAWVFRNLGLCSRKIASLF